MIGLLAASWGRVTPGGGIDAGSEGACYRITPEPHELRDSLQWSQAQHLMDKSWFPSGSGAAVPVCKERGTITKQPEAVRMGLSNSAKRQCFHVECEASECRHMGNGLGKALSDGEHLAFLTSRVRCSGSWLTLSIHS